MSEDPMRRWRKFLAAARRVGKLLNPPATMRRPGSGRGAPPAGNRPTAGRAAGQPVGHAEQNPSCPSAGKLHRVYPGDFTGVATLEYAPYPDDKADPGEVVWTWVPYQEDYCQGKDRPVLVIGRHGEYLLAAMLTTVDHSNRHHQDPHYLDIGTGPWDPQRRASEVKLDRILQIHPDDVRRIGAILDEGRFRAVQERLVEQRQWKR